MWLSRKHCGTTPRSRSDLNRLVIALSLATPYGAGGGTPPVAGGVPIPHIRKMASAIGDGGAIMATHDGGLLVLAYSAFAYRVFRGKTPEQGWDS
jgi:hypothetical protein